MHRRLISVASGAALALSIVAIGAGAASATSTVTCKSLTGTIGKQGVGQWCQRESSVGLLGEYSPAASVRSNRCTASGLAPT